jgi:hypothetical protein
MIKQTRLRCSLKWNWVENKILKTLAKQRLVISRSLYSAFVNRRQHAVGAANKFRDRPFRRFGRSEPLTSLAAARGIWIIKVGRTTPIGMMDPEVFNHGSVCSSL